LNKFNAVPEEVRHFLQAAGHHDNLRTANYSLSINAFRLFQSFVDLYSPSVFSVVARLTGLPNEKEVVSITADVLVDLWDKRQELSLEKQTGVFIYKIILLHIFSYLQARGNEDRISLLKNTLLIDPVYYSSASDS